jgi:hypothetical protein
MYWLACKTSCGAGRNVVVKFADPQEARAALGEFLLRQQYPASIDNTRMVEHEAWWEGFMHPGQRRVWDSTKRFVAMLAGAQGGKSITGPEWMLREIRNEGPGDYLAVTATYDLFKLAMLPALLDTFVYKLGIGIYKPSDRTIEIPSLSARIILRSAESDGGLESATAKAAWLDEAGQDSYTIGTWEAVLRRLSIHQGRVLLTTTLYNLAWLKARIYDKWAAGDPSIDVIQFDSTENPAFPRAEFERARESMPLWKFRMFYQGQYERPAGLIYGSFDWTAHKIPPIYIPPEWKRYMGLDFGGVNTAALFYAEHPESKALYLYREYKAGERTAAEHIRALMEGETAIPLCVGGSRSEGQWRHEFAAGGIVGGEHIAGLPIRPPDIKEVDVGIQRVYEAHKRNEIFVFDTCTGYLSEKESYSYVTDDQGEVLEPPTPEDKHRFHFCLAAGTLITTDQGSVPIEQVKVGTRVLTRQGYRRVTASWQTGVRPVKEVRLSNGATLVGTADHPVWISGQGFVPIAELCYNSIVQHQEANLWKDRQKFKSSTACDTTVTRKHRSVQIGRTSSDGVNIFIGQFGSTITGLSRMVATSITKTMILAITTYLTSIALQKRSTPPITPRTTRPNALSSHESGWITRGLRLLSGIARLRAERGTEHSIMSKGPTSNPLPGNASIAANPTQPFKLVGVVGSAPPRVRLISVVRIASILFKASADIVVRNLSIRGLSNDPFVPVRVLSVTDNGASVPVYNLTVDAVHEYYANGILVSNCDAERYIIGYLRPGNTKPRQYVIKGRR